MFKYTIIFTINNRYITITLDYHYTYIYIYIYILKDQSKIQDLQERHHW